MADKEKGKTHPFARMLRPNEEVLWMTSRAQQTAQQQREVIYAVLGTIGLFVMTALLFARRATTTDNPLPFLVHLSYEISPCCSLLAMIFLPSIWVIKQRWPTDYDYAVTNERLLYRHKDQVQTIDLEQLSAVSLFLTGETHGRLSFGEAFPGWYDLEDAPRIQRLILEAQQKRLKDS